MAADPRYSTIKVLIDAGHIKCIRDIFVFIPKTIVYKDLGANFNRFDKAIIDPSLFKLKELITLADMFGVDAKRMIDMAYEQAMSLPKSRRKK